MRGNAHVRFGGRAGETHITRVAQGAPVRPYYVKAGLEKEKAALLVVIGAMSDGRKQVLTQIPAADTRAQAEARRDKFAARYKDRYPKAVATLERDWERMVTFYDFPQQHWRHLRTTNPVESPFASVRLRTNAGKRYKRVQSATALIWRLLMVAEKHFRKLNAFELLPVVYAGQKHQDGKPIQEEKMSNKRRMKRADG